MPRAIQPWRALSKPRSQKGTQSAIGGPGQSHNGSPRGVESNGSLSWLQVMTTDEPGPEVRFSHLSHFSNGAGAIRAYPERLDCWIFEQPEVQASSETADHWIAHEPAPALPTKAPHPANKLPQEGKSVRSASTA